MSIIDRVKGLFKSGQGEAMDGTAQKADAWVGKTWNEIKNSKTMYSMNVWRSRLFYCGEFWIEIEKNTSAQATWKKVDPADDNFPMPRINEFSPAIDAVASNFNSIPEIEAIPKPDDDERVTGIAEIANALLDYCIKDNALRSDYKADEDKAGYAAQEFTLSGCVFTSVHPEDVVTGKRPKTESKPAYAYQCLQCDVYKRNLEEPVEACPQCGQPVEPITMQSQSPVIDESGQPVMEDITRKKIIVRVGDPVCAFARPGAKSMAGTPYHLWAERISLDEIWYRWNHEATADNEQVDGFNSSYEDLLNQAYLGYNQAQQQKDSALVIQAYVEPNKLKDFPDGFYLVRINGKLVSYKTWKEAFVEHPLTKFDFVQAPGLYFPRSIAFDMCEVQKAFVQNESLIELHIQESATEPIVADENSKVSEINGRGDKIIWWRAFAPGVKEPHRMRHGQLDGEVYKRSENLRRTLQTISHAVSVFRGEQPGSVTAASAIATLRGQAELQYAKPTGNWANGWKETGRKAVKNYQKYFTLPQIVEIVGEDKITQIEDFMRADLDTCLEFKATAAGLPKTRDERRQEMLTLFDKQALDINDPNVKEKVFELFGDTGMMKTFNSDARRARTNMRRIKSGQPANFRPQIDNASIHLGIALETAKGLDFDGWPPEAQSMLEQYIDQVRQAQSMEAQNNALPPTSGPQAPLPA
jgi:hypothetical protein